MFAATPDGESVPAIEQDDFAVVMTHSFEQDRAWLRLLLPRNLPYVGILGARHRSARLADELSGLLGWPLEQVCERLRAPVGLDLGGDGAEAIALSIVAELQACVSHRPALSRRMDPSAIARQLELMQTVDHLAAQCVM